MIEEFEGNMMQKPDEAMKKEWKAPEMTQLNMKETKSGSIDANTEGSWWIFTWGPQS